MDSPDLEQVKAFAQAVYGQLDRLGLRWRLRPATVTRVDGGTVRARLDGDTEAVRVVSMVGPVAAGERVMVLTSPPAGSHIVGWAGGRLKGASAPAALFGMTGRESVTFAAAASHTRVIAFPKPFPAAPSVFVNITSTANVTGGWLARAYNVGTAGFTLYAAGPSAAWSTVQVDWLAVVA